MKKRKKYGGTRYNSLWDGSTWLILGLEFLCCVIPIFLDGSKFVPTLIAVWMLILVIVLFKSVYYRIDGDELVIYQFFVPKAYPIKEIASIAPSKEWISAPATSISHRLALRFTDRRILKSTMPLIISPVRQEEFIDQLLSVNPRIEVDN